MTPHPRILIVGLLLIAALMSGSAAAAEPQVGHEVSAAADLKGQLASPDEFGRLRYIIRFADPGARERYQRTKGDGRGFGWTNAATRALVSRIIQEQDARLSRAGRSFGRSLQPTHRYLAGQSAVALWLSPDEAQALARMPDVVSVQPDQIYNLDTFRGPEFIGAGAIWDGSAVPGQTALRGEGMVVAIIDSGITAPAEHDAFANDPSCGHGSETPDKLISALDCATATGGLCDGPDPLDHNGHGSHVAATAAGNRLREGVASPELAVPGEFDEISGVAPCAHIRSYKVCPGRSCFGAHILAAIESILLHADVDVANYSISGGSNPWNDLDRSKLDLIDAGVLVAASAGNAGPTPGTVSHRGPWLMSVGASSRDVDSAGNPATGDVLTWFSSRGPTPAPFENLQKPDIAAPGSGIFAADRRFFVSASGPGSPPDATRDIALLPGSDTLVQTPPFAGRAITRDPGQDPENDGCLGFPADFFADSVALVARGGCSFSTTINNAFAAGADFILVYNNASGAFVMDTRGQESDIEAFSISGEAGEALKDFIDASGGAAELDYLIPAGYGLKSGTSMSSPHVAGAAALVRQAHPDWTPMEVHSALRMSSVRSGLKEDGSTPWDWDDVGSGRVDLTVAAQVGLVMDESAEHFAAADPDQAGDVRTLNLPAIRDMNCQIQCSFTRTVRNALATPSRWSVSGSGFNDAFAVDIEPTTFAFSGDPADQQVLTITVTPSTDLTESVAFGAIDLVEVEGQSPPLHWTAAIRGIGQLPPIAEITPAGFEFDLQANGSASAALSIANLGLADLVFGIDQAEPFSVKLEPANESLQKTEGPSEPIALVVDALDGTFDGVGVADQSILWFNRFTPAPLDLPFVLETVQYLEAPGSSLGLREGDIYDAYIWSSTDGDPASGNEVLLAAITGQQMGASVGLIDIPLSDGGVPIDSNTGDVLIGVVNRTRRDATFPAVSDGSAVASQQRSWILSNFPGGEPADPPVFANAGSYSVVDDTVVGGRNWIIRGYGTGGSACLAPGDVSWLAVTPQSGSVAQNETATLAIDVNMEGLGTGAFEARLCIETNDPDLPVAVVPVTVNVVASPEPAIGVAPTELSARLEENQQQTASFDISNSGEQTLNWSIEKASAACELPVWASVAANTGSLEPGQKARVDVAFDATGLDPAQYAASVCIESNDPDRPLVNVTLELAVLRPPATVSGTVTSLGYCGDALSNLAGANITVQDQSESFTGVSDADGHYSIDTPAAEDLVTVTASDSSHLPTAVTGVALTAGQSSLVDFALTLDAPCATVSPDTFALVLVPGNAGTAELSIDNVAGGRSLVWSLDSAYGCFDPVVDTWLSMSDIGGTVVAGERQRVDLTIDSTGLESGLYQTGLCILTSDSSAAVVSVPVILEVLSKTVFSDRFEGAEQ